MPGLFKKQNIIGKKLPSGDYVLTPMDIKNMNDTIDNLFLKVSGNLDVIDFANGEGALTSVVEKSPNSVKIAFNKITENVQNTEGQFQIINGKLVVTNSNGTVVIDGQSNIHKIFATGLVTMHIPANAASCTLEVNHNLGYIPVYNAYNELFGSAQPLPYEERSNQGLLSWKMRTYITSSILYFDFQIVYPYTYEVDFPIRYYIYKEAAF